MHGMAKRSKPPRPFRRQPGPLATRPAARSAWPRVDYGELITGAFVLVSSLLPASPWFAHANGIVATTVLFELAMAWLAMLAHGASFASTRAGRVALVSLGAVMVVAAGTWYAVELGRPALILPGLCLVILRLRPAPGVRAFDPAHCRCIAFEGVAAWLTLVAVFVLYVLVHALSGGTGPAQMRQDGGFALAWGGFYATLSVLMPIARRLALRQRTGPASA
jgi:hypothetical protein